MGVPRLSRAVLALAVCGAFAACQAANDALHPAVVAAHIQALRPTPGSGERPPTFDRGDKIETFDSADGFFRVHFTRAGRHAVPDDDRDRDGVPDYVSTIASDYEEVLAFYRGLGYRDPLRDAEVAFDNGGDDRFDVYLLDFPTSADGEFRTDECTSSGCSGHMLLENDFAGRRYASPQLGARLVSSHEFFHAVQHAYLPDPSAVLGEGTAVWASEAFDRTAGDLETQAPGYLERPDRSLGEDSTGPVDPFSYGSALFFEYLDEAVERALLCSLWERLGAGPASASWISALDAVLRDAYSSSLGAEFAKFAEWNLYTAGRADPAHGYAQGEEFSSVKERAIEAGYADEDVRVFPLAARYYELTAAQASPLVASAGLSGEDEIDGIELLVALEHDGKIVELQKSSGEALLQVQLDAEEGDTLHALLVNTRLEGESLKPDLCVGTPQQVARCRAGDSAADAGAAQTGAKTGKSDDGGCAVMRVRAGEPLALPPLAALATLAGVRKRRRRTRCA